MCKYIIVPLNVYKIRDDQSQSEWFNEYFVNIFVYSYFMYEYFTYIFLDIEHKNSFYYFQKLNIPKRCFKHYASKMNSKSYLNKSQNKQKNNNP